VLIVPAMGVPQRFYQAFATWLAATGRHVLTFDFRGSGLSRTAPLRQERADILTWAEQDAAAALAALVRCAPGLPVTWVGHSLGGQIVPLVPGHRAVAKVITVATGSGYWRENAPPLKKKVWFFWFGMVPVLTPATSRGAASAWRRPAQGRHPAVAALVPEPRISGRGRARSA